MEIHLKVIGWLLMILASAHVFFPWYFEWKRDLQSLDLINRQMMHVHAFFLALFLFLMGLLCAFFASDLVSTLLGKTLCIGLTLFWAVRLFFQWFVYSSALWKGKRFETSIHILFSLFWIYLVAVFGWAGGLVAV